MDESTKGIAISIILFIILSGIVIIIFNNVGEHKQPSVGEPVGTVYSNGTYIRLDGTIEPLSIMLVNKCQIRMGQWFITVRC